MALKWMSGKDSKLVPGSARLTEDTPFQITEAYKILRTNLLFALAPGQNKTVVISSALPSEGKSTTCSNVAITMAQNRKRVLLLDADLRKPTQHQIFRFSNKKGLTTLLAGFDSLGDVLLPDVEPGVDLLPCGPIPPNPSELLGSKNMGVLLDKLNEHYDYIFLDTPPINVVTDAMILASRSAGVILVARQRQSTYEELTKAISSIEFAGANILGIVINNVREKGGGYGRYRYRYQYKYAHREDMDGSRHNPQGGTGD